MESIRLVALRLPLHATSPTPRPDQGKGREDRLELQRHPPDHVGKVGYSEMHDEVCGKVHTLLQMVTRALPTMDPKTAGTIAQLQEKIGSLNSSNSNSVKGAIRNLLWDLRCHLDAGPAAGHAPSIRLALEKARTACFDISWERSLTAYPCRHVHVRPAISDVPNYRVVDRRIVRGGQPDQDGENWLMSHGVDAEIDLRASDRDNQWVTPSWKGIKRYSIPIEDMKPPTFEQVEQFVNIMNNPNIHQAFIHCKAGLGRTSAMVACWRITRGSTAEMALSQENFSVAGAHLSQEAFIRSFEKQWRERHPEWPCSRQTVAPRAA